MKRKNIKFKTFINLSKYITNFDGKNKLGKIRFYLSTPLRYMLFKKVYNLEMQGKFEKKEVE